MSDCFWLSWHNSFIWPKPFSKVTERGGSQGSLDLQSIALPLNNTQHMHTFQTSRNTRRMLILSWLFLSLSFFLKLHSIPFSHHFFPSTLTLSHTPCHFILSSSSVPSPLSLCQQPCVLQSKELLTSRRHLFEALLPLCEIPDKETALASILWGNDILLAMTQILSDISVSVCLGLVCLTPSGAIGVWKNTLEHREEGRLFVLPLSNTLFKAISKVTQNRGFYYLTQC